MATKKPAKKTTKKSYAAGTSKSRPAKPRPRAGKKGGKKAGGGGGNGAEDPIIVGGGSLFLRFPKKFKRRTHLTKHKFEHEDSPNLTRLIISRPNTTDQEIPLTQYDEIKIYHTAAERRK